MYGCVEPKHQNLKKQYIFRYHLNVLVELYCFNSSKHYVTNQERCPLSLEWLDYQQLDQ